MTARTPLPSPLRAPLAALALGLAAAAPAAAQTNLRAWNADGQVWLVWQDDRTFTSNEAYEVYQSPAPIADVTTAARVGRLLPPDWQQPRIRAAAPGATWTIPDGLGGTYTLAPDEALFVATPHLAGPRHYAVVKSGETLPPAGAAAGPVTPTLETPRPHVQLTGVDAGHPYTVHALWVDGRADLDSGRPGFPVMAGEHFNGLGHVFAVFEPPSPPPPGPLPVVSYLHGGQGSFWGNRPSNGPDARLELGLDDGLYVTFDDSHWIYVGAPVDAPLRLPSRWYGYAEGLDRFRDVTPPPADGTRVLDYTQRRLDWVLDWLVATHGADPSRQAIAGLSMGGRGSWLYARTRADRVSACLSFVQAGAMTDQLVSGFFGTVAQNLPTVHGVGLAELFDPATLVPAAGDVPFTRFVDGTEDTSAEWGPKPAVYAVLEAARAGVHAYWDDREHVGGNGGWDGAHWVGSPRHGAPSLTRFRSDVSFPAISAFDNDPFAPGPQPDPGDPVVPANGDPFGTRGGYVDWDVDSVLDLDGTWSVELGLVNASPFANDVSPTALARVDVTIRRASRFRPAPLEPLLWRLADPATGATLRSGRTAADAAGVVTVPGVVLELGAQRLEVLRALRAPSAAAAPGTVVVR